MTTDRVVWNLRTVGADGPGRPVAILPTYGTERDADSGLDQYLDDFGAYHLAHVTLPGRFEPALPLLTVPVGVF